MTGGVNWSKETPEAFKTVISESADIRKKVVKEASMAAMGMDMDSILGRIKKKTRKMTLASTPLPTTRSVKDMTLAMSKIKVKTKRLTKKAGMVSPMTQTFIRWGRDKATF
jgi:hypothetical protein